LAVGGDAVNQAYLVLRGLVQITEPGRNLTGIVGPGEIFGFSGLVFDQPNAFSCRAFVDSWIARGDAGDFIAVVFDVAQENMALLRDFFLKRWWGGTILRTFNQAGLSVEQRLERALRDLGDKIGVRDSRGTILDASISQQALAELIGASRPKTTEAIAKLICSGRVIRDHRRMILVDENGAASSGAHPKRRVSGHNTLI
jgi:CRP-like cAMP-binding protein